MFRTAFLALAAFAVVASLAGCRSTGRARSESTVGGLNDLRAEANKGKVQVEATIATMTAIQESEATDLKVRYEDYLKELRTLESLAETARSKGQAMRDKGAAYFKTWEEQIGTISSPDVRKRSEERRAELNELYSTLTASMDNCRLQYAKLSTDLTDIKQALDLDLTPKGVKSLSKPMKSARSGAENVDEAIDDVLEKLDALATELNTIQGQKP